MTPARNRLDRYDEHGQDTWTAPDEESFAAEMGQPSTEPAPHHETTFPKGWGEKRIDQMPEEEFFKGRYPAVLAQTPVQCNKCDRMAVPFEDVIVLVDGVWMHDECVQP